VKIDIPTLLVKLRERGRPDVSSGRRFGMRLWRWLVASPWRYRAAQRMLRWTAWPGESGWISEGPGPLGAWTQVRDLPPPPLRSFRDIWKQQLNDAQSRAREAERTGRGDGR
jgi:L-lactate dehydrogenase complex protein LldF